MTALTWIEWRDHEHPSSIELAQYLASLPIAVCEVREGEIDALEEDAAAGEIDETDERVFAPVATQPDLYELKWHFPARSGPGVEVRQYHSEPALLTQNLVRLHRHIKQKSGIRRIKDRQNEEMAHAQMRHIGGMTTSWGTS